MNGIIIFFQYFHKDILDCKKVKAFIKIGKQVHVQKIVLHLGYKQVPVKAPLAGLIAF